MTRGRESTWTTFKNFSQPCSVMHWCCAGDTSTSDDAASWDRPQCNLFAVGALNPKPTRDFWLCLPLICSRQGLGGPSTQLTSPEEVRSLSIFSGGCPGVVENMVRAQPSHIFKLGRKRQGRQSTSPEGIRRGCRALAGTHTEDIYYLL